MWDVKHNLFLSQGKLVDLSQDALRIICKTNKSKADIFLKD